MRLRIDADIPDRWVGVFLGFLKRLEYCGRIGMSRKTTIYADGDGDFRPTFTITADSQMPDVAAPIEDDRGEQLFDAG